MTLLKLFGQQRAVWLAGFVGFSLAACQAPAVKMYPYLVKVRIEGCQDGTGRLLGRRALGLDLVDSAKLEQGQLVFRGLVEHPGVYKVFCRCSNKVTSNLELYLPADSVEATVTPGANLRPDIYQPAGLGKIGIGSYLLNTQLFSTAPQQREVAAYLQTRDSLWNKYFLDKAAMAANMSAAIAAGNKPEIDRWGDATRVVQEKFPDYLTRASELYIKRHPRSEVNLFALLDASDTQLARQRLRPYYLAMSAARRASYFGQLAGQRFGQAQQAAGKQ